MRTLTAVTLALATATAVPAIAAAQQMSPPVMAEQSPDQVLSDKYIGAEVVAGSPEGVESVGTVSDLVLGPDNKIVGVIVDVGGFLGVAAKPVGLSWASLSEEQNDGELMLRTSLSRAELEEAPEFKTLEAKQVESDQKMMEQEQPPATLPAQ
ncbi:PRC-barrel domain-containing protein [Pelagibius sp. 7325]|uniref:PRC-barrel domain-containing protein n=1 Tax=Pelagibius sp. 7325 TaxID=3131994 RepID=UPI0030EF0209